MERKGSPDFLDPGLLVENNPFCPSWIPGREESLLLPGL